MSKEEKKLGFHENETFKKAFDLILDQEGGYIKDPSDKGGETKYGISKRSYPDLNIKNLSIETAKKIYFVDYWLKQKCAFLDEPLALKLFSLSVNMGNKRAALLLQKSLNLLGASLKEDGIIGPKTLEAVEKKEKDVSLLDAFKKEAASFYKEIVARDPSQRKYLNGWLYRAEV
jgi:lysozyme family protein